MARNTGMKERGRSKSQGGKKQRERKGKDEGTMDRMEREKTDIFGY